MIFENFRTFKIVNSVEKVTKKTFVKKFFKKKLIHHFKHLFLENRRMYNFIWKFWSNFLFENINITTNTVELYSYW